MTACRGPAALALYLSAACGSALADDIALSFVNEFGRVDVASSTKPTVTVVRDPVIETEYAVRVQVSIHLAKSVCDLTLRSIGKPIHLVVGCETVAAPVVQAALCDGIVQIHHGYSRPMADALAARIRDGARPCVKPRPSGSPQ